MANQDFQVGVGRVSITPPLTAPHASWGAQVHVLPDGVEADLWATVLVATDENRMAAFVDLDLVIVSRGESDEIRAEVASALGITPEDVRISVTHNHAGPPPSAWNWTEQGQVALEQYYALLPSLTAGAARLALRDLRPAQVAAGTGESRVAVNRRETAPNGRTVTGVNLDGLIDPQVLVLRIDDLDHHPIAAVVGYTMHPTTLGPTNRLVSPDWPGHMKRTVEAITGATCLFAQGATGDIGPGPKGFTDDIQAVRGIGAQVGCEAARVFLSLDLPAVTYRHERIWESGAPLGKWTSDPIEEAAPVVKAAVHDLHLPVRPQPPEAEAATAVAEAQRKLAALKAAGAPAKEVEAATFVTKRANMTHSRARTYGGHDTYPVELHLLQIGPAVFAGIEGEPFFETGLAIKRESPFAQTWFGGYTGGWAGYIATPEEFPRQGYEVEISPFTEEAASHVVSGTLAALKELAAR